MHRVDPGMGTRGQGGEGGRDVGTGRGQVWGHGAGWGQVWGQDGAGFGAVTHRLHPRASTWGPWTWAAAGGPGVAVAGCSARGPGDGRLSPAAGDEDCLWYVDRNGSWHPGFDCNFFTFCCGTCHQRYCCRDPLRLITERQQRHCLAFRCHGCTLLGAGAGCWGWVLEFGSWVLGSCMLGAEHWAGCCAPSAGYRVLSAGAGRGAPVKGAGRLVLGAVT